MSETYEVIDAWKKNIDRTASYFAYDSNNGTVEIKDDYTELREDGKSTNCNLRFNLNVPLEHIFEFDINLIDGDNYPIFCRWIQDSTAITGITGANLGLNIGEWSHIKLKFNSNGTVTCIHNNTTYNAPATDFDSSKQYVQVIFQTRGATSTIQFKNINIYPF